MKGIPMAFAILAVTACSPALAANMNSDLEAQPGSPQIFVNQAAPSNIFEIQSSKLALAKSGSADVKAFAQRMIDDHTAAASKLEQAAAEENISNVPSALNARQRQQMTELEQSKGSGFDRQYSRMQLQAHKDAVALFRGYEDHGDPLGKFAANTLPTLQSHLDMAQKLAK